MPGFVNDVDTFGLWQMDELAAGNYTSIIDAKAGARHLVAVAATAPKIVNAKNTSNVAVRYAKYFDGAGGTIASLQGDATALALYQTDHTVEAIARADALTALMTIWCYGGTGDAGGAPTNHQSLIGIQATNGRPRQFWEHGAGTNDDVLGTAAGSSAQVGEWFYVAAVVDRTANTVRFAFRRASASSCTFENVAYASDPTGGADTTVHTRIGTSGVPAQPEYFQGAVSCIRISTTKRSDAELEAQADKLETTMKFDDDASTFGLYLLNEEPDAIDDSDRGQHMQAFGTMVHGVDPLTDVGRAKYFSGTNSVLHAPLGPEALAMNTMFKGESCIEILCRVGDGNTASRGITIFGDPGPETAANNFYGWEFFGTRTLRTFSEHGGGLDDIDTTPILYTTAQAVSKHVWALNTRIVTGQQVKEIYRDGVLVDTSPNMTLYSDGEAGFFRIGFGPDTTYFFGVIDCVRVSSRARTADELLESYEGVIADTSPPVVGVPSPAASSLIDRLQMVTVPITDDVGVDTLTVVVTTGGDVLAAYDAGAFSALFTGGGSQLTGPVTSRVLTLRPAGGWVGPVTIRVTARDANGNEDERSWSYTINTSSISAPAPAPIAIGSGGFGLVP